MTKQRVDLLIAEFAGTLDVEWTPPGDIRKEAEQLLDAVPPGAEKDAANRQASLFALVNTKFGLNSNSVREFVRLAGLYRIYPNYHDRCSLSEIFDRADHTGIEDWIRGFGAGKDAETALLASFAPVAENVTVSALHSERADPKKFGEVLTSLFRGYVYKCFDEQVLHEYFNKDCRSAYYPSFYDHLKAFYPAAIHRDESLISLVVDEELFRRFNTYEVLREALFQFVRASHQRLTNHCYLAIRIKSLSVGERDVQWELFADLTLYAEKHIETRLSKGYFRPAKIAATTLSYIPELDAEACEFAIANEGFFFTDCFVLCRPAQDDMDCAGYEILLLFQKNERDETLIPCPACRSVQVQGNSYPVLGVRSWECINTFCPETSKYNRGNRYSLQSLIKQEAIEQEHNQIPLASVRRWKRDVVEIRDDSEVLDMLIRHYTLCGDRAILINHSNSGDECSGRLLHYEAFPDEALVGTTVRNFFGSPFFRRFRVRRVAGGTAEFPNLSNYAGVAVYHGDAFEVLRALESESIDGAVTSPPYYNAREYAQWSNIYCYLYDMYNIAAEVYRVLKPGATFLFNIFDYFDNENSIVFSAMGQKRMILGAYIVHLFRDLGFGVAGNIIWDKGEIEGKRNFNQGNMSPYYQTPLNCWEHVLVFRKGQNGTGTPSRKVFQARPVMKMVRGRNTLGHSAPFPSDIPDLLLDMLPNGGIVLDPFSGSMTTGLTAYRRGYKSISIDYHEEYCRLGLQRFIQEVIQAGEQLVLV